ncbi:hypothetical protein R1sor_007414 [Riccia sorocarpa]|uniref:Phospholipase D n=1 Tax=Riccia sorocarpa TaxID=122646 RepID=A0ABD3HQS7_9MARC
MAADTGYNGVDGNLHEYIPSNGTGAPKGFDSQGQMQDIPLEQTPSMAKSHEKVLLHGSLDVYIYRAKELPNMDLFSEKLRQAFSVFKICKAPFTRSTSAGSKSHRHHVITSDPYVSVVLAGARLAKTKVITNNQDPVWNQHFVIPVAHTVSEVVFSVKDDDMLGAQQIGNVEVPVDAIVEAGLAGVEGWFDVIGSTGKIVREGAQLHLKVKYLPVYDNPLYRSAVEPGPDYHGVPNTYFPLRKGGNVVLYHDAHVEEGTLPDFRLDNGKQFHHRRCWEEICTAILEAHHLVYIAGWSIFCKIKLMRDAKRPIPDGGDLTLGDLLKRKSKEGVRVLLLVWDDKTSHSNPLIKTVREGVMGVHDEETKRFFRHSAVRCVLAPRYGDSKLSWFRQRVVGTLYTHHQKIVLCDTQGPGNTRKVTSFLGGLDLCDGRYDTPSHFIFRHLDTVYKDDYHNPTFSTKAEAGGPRQPWHDLHCRIDGPAAYDVLTNFEQRWKKATRWHDDELIEITRISWILGPTKETSSFGAPHLMVTEDEDEESWHVQVFRSIDSGSAKGFPKKVEEAVKQNLVWRKNIAVDVSIQTAYIKAIRGAQKFIYIENQYFIGSSYAWPDYKTAGADQMIPIELALKIASKIRANERFAVYVAIPLWPEGVPDSAAVQEILYFQSQTVQMMYTIIADAIRDSGRSEHPRDYLNFYTLGNRETPSDLDPTPTKQPDAKQAIVQKTRRMMIYIHSKGMIVDDEYVIIGSANINQRSMDGSRDTEIAMGAYQPHRTHARALKHPHGQIYGYRMALWAEHLGFVDESFNDPASLECVHTINEAAEKNWEQYIAEEVTDMKGHLMPYPYQITPEGQVTYLPGIKTFPDVGGDIIGTNTQLPDNLTT